jgi:hypothetical protein
MIEARKFRRTSLAVTLLLVALAVAALVYFRGGQVDARNDVGQPPSEHVAVADAPKSGDPAATPSQRSAPTQPVAKSQSAHNAAAPEQFSDRIASVAANYEQLARAARAGDVEAALALDDVLRACSEAPRTQAALDDRIKQAAVDYPVDSKDYANTVQFATVEFQQCQPFSKAQIDGRLQWLAMAAATGDRHAQESYVFWGRPDDPKSDTYLQDTRDYVANSRKYMAELIAAGDPSGLILTSNSYGPGEGITAINSPDPIAQYAYLYAYCLATECRNVSLAGLQKLGAGLSPQELSNATSQGQAIYKKCCAK